LTTDTVLLITEKSSVHEACAAAADAAGVALIVSTGEQLPALAIDQAVLVAVDEHVLADGRSIQGLRSAVRTVGAIDAPFLLLVDDLAAALTGAHFADADDVVRIGDQANLHRGIAVGLKVARERVARRVLVPEVSRRLRETVTEQLSDVIFHLSADLRIMYVNTAWKSVLGYSPLDQTGRSFLDFVDPAERDTIASALHSLASGEQTQRVLETTLVASDGRAIPMELRALADFNPTGVGAVTGLLLDISSRRETDAELRASHEHYRELALRDPLTGLSNRLVFADRLQHALDAGVRRGSGLALLFIDLDHFKPVNDTHGHAIGDRVLAEVAARLNEQIRAGDTLARYGGDEFAVILEDLSDPTQALQIADQLIESLRAPIKVGVEEIAVGICVGITILSGRKVSFEEAIGEADTALYQAKQSGRNQYSLYELSHEPGQATRYRFDLRRGMEDQELRLIYLPIFDLETGAVSSLEARVRWDHPVWGRLAPNQFLRRADASEVMGELAREALALMVHDLQTWRDQGLPIPQVRIALAVWQALDSDLVSIFAAAQSAIGFEPGQFAIEFMDGSTANERDALLPVIEGLRSLGIAIGFDNFITGSTPLGGVVDMRPAYVNLYANGHALADRGMNSRDVVAATKMLCDAFGWQLVSKEVDTPEMLSWIRTLPIRYAQGDALATGVDVDAVADLLRRS
jgi:diguanylate cyclase (GGDEF)-like protein/PAS domain S-box-containing protein